MNILTNQCSFVLRFNHIEFYFFLKIFEYLRVPSNRVAMVSKNVFCGANSPFLAGIEKSENFLDYQNETEIDKIELYELLFKFEYKENKRRENALNF